MSSGSGAGTRTSFLLVSLMILPTLVSASAMTEGEVLQDSEGPIGRSWLTVDELGVPHSEDPAHGWLGSNGIGEAWLFHRKAAYVPLLDWNGLTGEKDLQGWYVLGHEYPIPTGVITDGPRLSIPFFDKFI